jgi:hypothetical protein
VALGVEGAVTDVLGDGDGPAHAGRPYQPTPVALPT